jgi:hypothetical protein
MSSSVGLRARFANWWRGAPVPWSRSATTTNREEDEATSSTHNRYKSSNWVTGLEPRAAQV